MATYLGYHSIVTLLLQHGVDVVDVNKSDKLGETPLFYASWEGFLDAFNILLNAGANSHARSNVSA